MRIFTPTVAGKTILIVGVGHIGGGAAEQAKKLGMRVLGIRRSKNPHPAVEEMHGAGALHQLLPKADIVLLNTSLTSTTRFLFSREEFHLMKPGAAFINMSRGGLVDPKALEEALRTDRIGCAIIDVTFPEPLPTDSTLWDSARSHHHAPTCFQTILMNTFHARSRFFLTRSEDTWLDSHLPISSISRVSTSI